MLSRDFFTLKTIILLITLFGFQVSILSETVILSNHEVIHGKITFQDANVLRLNNDSGKSIEIQKNEILKVSYRDVKDEKEIEKIIVEEERKIPVQKRKKVVKVDKKLRWSIVWRSSIIPGWGQWKAGKKIYAVLPFLAFVGVGAYTYGKVLDFKSAEATYNQNSILPILYIRSLPQGSDSGTSFLTAVLISNSIFQPYGKAQNEGNTAIQLLIGVYSIQLIHSYFIGRDWEMDKTKTAIGNKEAWGNWNVNAFTRQAQSTNGIARESYYEVNYLFQF